MPSVRFHLEWILPLEPGLVTRVVLHDAVRSDDDTMLVGAGADEPEALFDLWMKLTDQRAAEDAITCVERAYVQRTGHALERTAPDETPPLAGAPVAPLTTDEDTEGG